MDMLDKRHNTDISHKADIRWQMEVNTIEPHVTDIIDILRIVDITYICCQIVTNRTNRTK